MTSYAAFLATKKLTAQAAGFEVPASALHPAMFSFQRDVTCWAIRKGRAALFLDTGLGKSLCQLEWARRICEEEGPGAAALILAPLSVARQTVAEAAKWGIEARYVRTPDQVGIGINVTNYELAARFAPAAFVAVVCDESSILKGLDGKTRQQLTEQFRGTPYRLCCTATPAPNDIAEIANHAEFLGVMSRVDMLATFFVHDDEGWRLKGHAVQQFYRWLASWSMAIRVPSDLGYADDGYILPPLTVTPVFVDTGYVPEGQLFATKLKGITDRTRVRRATLASRVAATADRVNASTDQWIVWCGLDDEGQELHKAIPGSVLVEGSQSPDAKADALEAFQDGRYRVLITKVRIAGFGMNFQNANHMAFCGLNDSWEGFYQAIRRSWRFGQARPVNVVVVLSEAERDIYDNVLRKQEDATRMTHQLIESARTFEQAELNANESTWDYTTSEVSGTNYRLMLGDSVERMAEVADNSVDLSVFSPPFQSLYTYSPTERDLGNSRTPDEFYHHFRYIVDHLFRVTKPGRNCAVHVQQVTAMLVRDGYIGIKDFRGDVIRLFEDCGFVYHGDVTIDKDPQAQAIRTKSKALLFVQLHKDSSWTRPALADYILIFRKPGENAVPITPDVTNDEWIAWARPIWYGIRESDTLNTAEGRDNADERHIAPLQLGTIERIVRLWSNPGELVCSPFAGIGSEGYQAIKLGRKFVGCELKPSYFRAAAKNLAAAASQAQGSLFSLLDVPA